MEARMRPRWSWSNLPTDTDAQESTAAASSDAHRHPNPEDSRNHVSGFEQTQHEDEQQQQRHYKPRTCRICFEVVQPNTDMDSPGSVAGMFGSRPKVKYVSEDPGLGRLFSPCKCKGSQKYVHEGCLKAWRSSAPYSDRNFWKCPICLFEYRLERLRWSRWIASRATRAVLTLLVLAMAVFVLGFVADPIIGLWVDPLGRLSDALADIADELELDGFRRAGPTPPTWSYHFIKGFMSLGLLGAIKSFFSICPWWNYLHVRLGGGRRRADRMQNVNLMLVAIGIFTFLMATWKVVSIMAARLLDKASEGVMDIQGDDDDYGDEPEAAANSTAESRKHF